MIFSKNTVMKVLGACAIILASTIINANYRPIQEKIHIGINWVYKQNNPLGDALFAVNKTVFNGASFDIERQTKHAIYSGFSSVVMIRVSSTDPQVQMGGTGTGFIVKIEGDDAWIMTNHHVIAQEKDNPDAWEISVNTAIDMWTYQATLIGVDEIADIAIIKITKQDNENWEAVEFADEAGVGDPITVLGHGMSLPWTSTSGIISYKDRYGTRPYSLMIQVDAVINQGNSGGPVMSSDGKVVGVAQSILSPGRSIPGWDGVGMAVGAEQAQRSMNYIMSPQYVAKGYVPYAEYPLSMATFELKDVAEVADEDRHYAYIDYPVNGQQPTVGELAGLLQDDVLLEINGEPARSSWVVLKKTVMAFPGDEWDIKVLRGEEEVLVTIALREMDREKLLKSLSPPRGGR